ncbi:MAG: hypothetical protein RJB66_874 [Pseudomonadota bacterium]|jgi:cell division protein FtsB
MGNLGLKIKVLLERPVRVGVICLALLTSGLVFDGSLWRLYDLRQNHQVLLSKLLEETDKIEKLELQMGQLKNPAYIEKQARDRLEFLEKDDLLFVFSED